MADKQAVLLIHGIGEQRPMQTLRGFVNAVWSTDTAVHHQYSRPTVWSKPDTISGSFELRRLTTGQNRGDMRTDFFEYYWAHMMTGTQLAHVLAWAKLLLFRSPRKVPQQLRAIWWLLWLTTIAITGLFFYNGSLPAAQRVIPANPLVSTISGLVVSVLVSAVVVAIIGDAARYLDAAPPNIERRQEIRAKGIALLKKLHEADYTRIIVVGHSLGSVIGYDIITHAWAEFNTKHNSPDAPAETRLSEVEALISVTNAQPADYRKAQRAYLGELHANGNDWRVTDFITAGSPLTHAAILLAYDSAELTSRESQREFPTAPPATEKGRISYPLSYKTAADVNRTLDVPHHAAPFAATRWANLYFPNSYIVRGDLVGGPLRPLFGNWVTDVPVTTSAWAGFLSHTHYWTLQGGNSESKSVLELRAALDLADDGR